MIPFCWSTLDEEFDEPLSQTELLEGIAHGHLNAAHEFRHPQTQWRKYYAHPEYMEPCHYHTSFETAIPLELIIHHLIERLSNLKLRPEYPPPPRPLPPLELKKLTEEEAIIAKMEASTLYDDWVFFKAKLKALRKSHVRT